MRWMEVRILFGVSLDLHVLKDYYFYMRSFLAITGTTGTTVLPPAFGGRGLMPGRTQLISTV